MLNIQFYHIIKSHIIFNISIKINKIKLNENNFLKLSLNKLYFSYRKNQEEKQNKL